MTVARTVGSAAEHTRQRILDAALQLMVEQGYAGTSVRDIAEQLRMTKGSLYYHFSSKDDLLYALLTPLVEALDEFVAEARAAGRMSGALLGRLVELFDEHAPLLRALMGDPSVARGMMLRHRLPERLGTLLEVLGGGANEAARLRARCVLGVIHAGVLAPSDPTLKPELGGPEHCPPQPRLSEAEKSYVTTAARAVLAVPFGGPTGGTIRRQPA
jgi:AcrR family transcriptional regulator